VLLKKERKNSAVLFFLRELQLCPSCHPAPLLRVARRPPRMHPLATEITAGITAGAAKTLAFYPLDTLVTRREVGRPLLVPRETLEGARPAAIRDVYAGSVLATLGMLPYALLFHTAFYLCEAALARFAISAALVKARPERSHPPPAHPLCLSGGSLFAGAHGSDEPRTMLIFSPTEAPRLVLGSAALGF